MKRLTLILAIVLCFCALPCFSAVAEVDEFSSVLDDLYKSETFDVDEFPFKNEDYSLSLITVAESTNKDLFLYVYQPGGEDVVVASSVNLLQGELTIEDGKYTNDYKVHTLTLIDCDGVFFKYKVNDFTMDSSETRSYDITAIFRPFISGVDKQATGDNTITEVPFEVSKKFVCGMVDGKYTVKAYDTETIEITSKFVGFVRYDAGFKLYVGACDSHFVAFNTDKDMDRVLEAEVYYTSQKYSWSFNVVQNEEFGDKVSNHVELDYTQNATYSGDGLFARTYSWDRIQTVSDFIANETRSNIYSGAILEVKSGTSLTDTALTELQDKKWVLRFAETSYSRSTFTDGTTVSTFEYSTLVGDVTILRLKFETDGVIYNLGVVDNRQTGSRNPSNKTEVTVKVKKDVKTTLALILTIIILILILMLLFSLIKKVHWSAVYKDYVKRTRNKNYKKQNSNKTYQKRKSNQSGKSNKRQKGNKK